MCMKLFNKNKKSITQYDREMIMAKEIINYLGVIKNIYGTKLAKNVDNYNEYIYEGYGLKLVFSENDGLYIKYNDEMVLGTCYMFDGTCLETTKVYIPGKWEKILTELYRSIPFLSYSKRKDDSLYKKGINVLRLIDSLGECTINDSLHVDRNDVYTGNDRKVYQGTTYNVYYDGEVVFSGYVSNHIEKVYVYENGEWIKDIKEYIMKLLEQRNQLKNENKKIKLLRSKKTTN